MRMHDSNSTSPGNSSLESAVDPTVHVSAKKRQYSCEFNDCEFVIDNSEHLDYHVILAHTGSPPYVCEEHEKSWMDKANYRNHIYSSKHLNYRPYKCDWIYETGEECPYASSTKTHLRTHYNRHTGDKSYKCEECKGTYPASSDLRRHQYRCKDIRRFQCPWCIHAAHEKYELIDHIKRHFDYKEYYCQNCNDGYVSSHELKQHTDLQACTNPSTLWREWELFCFNQIVPIVFQNSYWEFQPRIMTPHLDDKKYISPDIMVRHDGLTEIIDVKLSSYLIQSKDLEIYPNFADKVTFWSLYGESKVIEFNETRFSCLNSHSLREFIIRRSTADDELVDEVLEGLERLYETNS